MRLTLRRLVVLVAVALIGLTHLTSPAHATDTPDAPQLTSWLTDPGPYRTGDDIAFNYAVTNVARLHRIEVTYRENTTAQWHGFMTYWETFSQTGTGTVTYRVPTELAEQPNDVTYTVEMVRLQDVDGRWSNYGGDGSFGSDLLPGTTHDVPMTSQLTFVETLRDHTPPVLQSVSISPTDVTTNHEVTISYSATDLNLSSVVVWGKDHRGWWVELGRWGRLGLPATGNATWSIETPDTVSLVRVDVADATGNIARYYPGGRLTWGIEFYEERRVGSHHALMPSTPITVRPKAPVGLTAQAGSASVRLRWSQQADLGHRIVVSPGGTVLTNAGGQAERDVLVTGLTNGTSYSFSVVATSSVADSQPGKVSALPRMGPMRVFGTGDRSKDGRADLWAAPTATGTSTATWRIYQGAGGGKFKGTLTSTIPVTRAPIPGSATGRGPGAPMGALYLSGSDLIEPSATGTRVIGRGFNIFRTIDASSDLTGDGVADLIGITPAGDFYVYTSTSAGAIGRGTRLGGGWGAFQTVFSPGDFNGDTRSDVIGVDGLGKLWLYPGNGRGAFLARVQIGNGWGGFGSVLPMRDFSGDGKVDLGAITTTGALRMYPGNGRGGFLASTQIGTGWGAFL